MRTYTTAPLPCFPNCLSNTAIGLAAMTYTYLIHIRQNTLRWFTVYMPLELRHMEDYMNFGIFRKLKSISYLLPP